MSRGFVKEGDQEETPIIPPRAALPKGATNYVTPTGLQLLLDERKQLEDERATLPTKNEQERRIELAVINGKANLLNERIASARVLEPNQQPKNEVRFGATVTYKISSSTTPQTFQIVGVDEKLHLLLPLQLHSQVKKLAKLCNSNSVTKIEK